MTTGRTASVARAVVAAFAAFFAVAIAVAQRDPPRETPESDEPDDDGPATSASAPGPASGPDAPPEPAPLPTATQEGMVRVPGGTFRMGSTGRKAQPNETPVHAVTVSPFHMDVTEVTVGAYRACVTRGACVPPTITSSQCTWDKGDAELPMSCVSFVEAQVFCAAEQKRLPTEAEWELAARGTSERTYPWGDDVPDCEHAIAKKGDKTTDGCGDGPKRVDPRRGRSPYGVADLAGNVEEWVADHYDDRYPPAENRAVVDPRGPAVGTARVLRGGGFLSPRASIRVSARSWASAAERGANVGFRCAR